MQPGKHSWDFMLQVEPANLATRSAANQYALDYAAPARVRCVEGCGTICVGDVDDRNMDGFAEGRGCYLLSARDVARVVLHMDTPDQLRFFPAFEIHDWQGLAPRTITVDGARRHAGIHYNVQVDVEHARLVLQLLEVLKPGRHVLEIAGNARAN